MNKEKFIQLCLNPNIISKKDTIKIASILEEYPYFQAAQVLQLKGLKLQKSFIYNKTLKKVAAYTTNRAVLFDFITEDVFDYNQKIAAAHDILNEIEVVDSKIIEHLQKSIEAQEKDSLILENKNEQKVRSVKTELNIGVPLDFSKDDAFSFNEWLKLAPIKEVNRAKSDKIPEILTKKEKNNSDNKLKKQVNLIEKFIAKKPKIKTDKEQAIKDVAVSSVEENTTLMTETLAQVYIEQKKYSKAIAAFKILSLKYPEKSSFFADKIKSIEFLQKNKS